MEEKNQTELRAMLPQMDESRVDHYRIVAREWRWLEMIRKPTTTDSVLDEIHETRRETFERFGGDAKATLEDARQRQEAYGRPAWRAGEAGSSIPLEVEKAPPTAP